MSWDFITKEGKSVNHIIKNVKEQVQHLQVIRKSNKKSISLSLILNFIDPWTSSTIHCNIYVYAISFTLKYLIYEYLHHFLTCLVGKLNAYIWKKDLNRALKENFLGNCASTLNSSDLLWPMWCRRHWNFRNWSIFFLPNTEKQYNYLLFINFVL